MNKQLLIFFTSLVICLNIQLWAQDKFEPEWNIGVGFGSTFSTLSVEALDSFRKFDTKSLVSFSGGVSVRYITENHLGIIGELNFTQAGWEGKFEPESEFIYKRQLNYIDLPILTHIYFGSEKYRFFINLGPKIGYLVEDKEEMNSSLKDWLATNPDPDRNGIVHYGKEIDRKFDYGILGGLGLELRTSIGNFLLEGRYYMGLSDIFSNGSSDDFSRSANRVISARLTYYIKAF